MASLTDDIAIYVSKSLLPHSILKKKVYTNGIAFLAVESPEELALNRIYWFLAKLLMNS